MNNKLIVIIIILRKRKLNIIINILFLNSQLINRKFVEKIFFISL